MADISEENYIWDQIGLEINGGVTSNWRSRGSSSLSNDGTVLAVGSPDNADNGLNSGKVSIFNYSTVSNSWIQVGNDIKGQNIGDYFGISIKLSDDGSIIAIGANGVDANGNDSGQVRIFENIANVWTQIGSDINGVSKKDLSGCYGVLAFNSNSLCEAMIHGYPVCCFDDGSVVYSQSNHSIKRFIDKPHFPTKSEWKKLFNVISYSQWNCVTT